MEKKKQKINEATSKIPPGYFWCRVGLISGSVPLP